jgi:RNA polymerase sigma factor for flagellar operon FliA
MSTAQELATALGVAVSELDSIADDVQRAVVLSIQGFADPSSVEDAVVAQDPGPEDSLLMREQVHYLHTAVESLPDRLRTVVRGYFFEERPMAELAAELGVSESRVSQMRAEALVLLKDGMNSQLDPAQVPVPEKPGGCVARRREAYFATIAAQASLRSHVGPRTYDTDAVQHTAARSA